MTLFEQLASLQTEAVNPHTTEIDLASTKDVVAMLHAEDRTVADAVGLVLAEIAEAVDIVVAGFKKGGRLIYIGAGTSGRLGVVDASEMPPTYGTQPDMVQGLIAGGPNAVFRSVEGAEDSPQLAIEALNSISLRPFDVVCGITASGRTPFVLGGLQYAASIGCQTILISTNPLEAPGPESRSSVTFQPLLICPVVGAEPITGSTRMKSGTAQKMVLNMISTASMVRMGKTYGNVMVDLQLTNEKLKERAKGIVMSLGGVNYEESEQLLDRASGSVKTALVMSALNCSPEEAEQRLQAAHGFVRKALSTKPQSLGPNE
ncbi:MAG: N-acetylmuramic acid 6-phosphate etherase [Candidatus Kapabacteria bacterium]|nr:N-acetylmuramic acid 6-phosphate etherase [Candidatus Kapabacteria bacterium]